MAQRYWPGEDPVGKRLTLDEDLADPTWLTVVGVVGDMGFSLQGSLPGPPAPTLYVPFEQQPFSHMFIVTRTRGEPRDAIPVVRAALAQVDPQVPVQEFNTVPGSCTISAGTIASPAGFLGGLAILGLGLASIGLFGVMSFTVVQRTHEIGVRVALGAGRREIVRLVLGRCLRLALVWNRARSGVGDPRGSDASDPTARDQRHRPGGLSCRQRGAARGGHGLGGVLTSAAGDED